MAGPPAIQSWTWPTLTNLAPGIVDTTMKGLENVIGRLTARTQGQTVDVRDFVSTVDGFKNGTNQTAAINAATLAAGGITTNGVPYPGIVEFPSNANVLVNDNTGPQILLPTGIQIRGNGATLTVDPTSVSSAGGINYHVLSTSGYLGQNYIENLTINGNRANIPVPIAKQGNIGIFYANGTTDVLCFNVKVNNLQNHALGEAFGFDAQGGTARIYHVCCSGKGNAGSAFSMTGSSATTWGSTDQVLVCCDGSFNDWQGGTFFQTQYGLALGCRFIGNFRRGGNAEWCDTVQWIGCHMRGNGLEGNGTFGVCTNWVMEGGSCIGNNTRNQIAEAGEIGFLGGTSGTNVGIVKSARIINVDVQAGTVTKHVTVGERFPGASTGNPSAASADSANEGQGIFVSGPNVGRWRYGANTSPFAAKYSPNGIRIITNTHVALQTGHPKDWTLTNITTGTVGAGALGPNAKRFTQTVANTPSSAVAPTNWYAPGTSTLGKWRYCPRDANATWEAGEAGQEGLLRVPNGPTDIDVWFESDQIVTLPNNFAATAPQLATVSTTGTASVIDVDFVTFDMLPWRGSTSGS